MSTSINPALPSGFEEDEIAEKGESREQTLQHALSTLTVALNYSSHQMLHVTMYRKAAFIGTVNAYLHLSHPVYIPTGSVQSCADITAQRLAPC